MNVIGRWLLLAVISLGIAPIVAQADSRRVPPLILIEAVDASTVPSYGSPVYRWRTDGRALRFDASVEPLGFFADIYFGVIIPGGRTFTWTAGSTTGPTLVEGLHPAAQNVNWTDSFIASVSLGGAPQYAFSNGDSLGLYSLFILVLAPGADPSDPARWRYINMSPLILSE